uniref:Uncharacterized protein n=1 Tax=Chromera velia CCMP2878 TaxID=1169474 RepID=A0A0G4F6U2_9ALVE|eukprot:Cvel_15344.t1-p1 / transcript=Cvel_15344.t1 / gene=Cvel_15344 / organism=Chromera_velia_CCMP2878 / gene_product=hypothetical protein / transcript_product=hypothetical protein / location=Cvel_scaffold1129:35164-38985(+) / protein_length=268 / sequence_SO=supercontig / SO=protein_coding / is_pseudo=false
MERRVPVYGLREWATNWSSSRNGNNTNTQRRQPVLTAPPKQPLRTFLERIGPEKASLVSIPYEEQLYFASCVAATLTGALLGKGLLGRGFFGAALGLIYGIEYSRIDGKYAAWLAVFGRYILLAYYKTGVFVEDVKFNVRAWSVYQKGFKKFEQLDTQYKIVERAQFFDEKYEVSRKLHEGYEGVQGALVGAAHSANQFAEKLAVGLGHWLDRATLPPEKRQPSEVEERQEREQDLMEKRRKKQMEEEEERRREAERKGSSRNKKPRR